MSMRRAIPIIFLTLGVLISFAYALDTHVIAGSNSSKTTDDLHQTIIQKIDAARKDNKAQAVSVYFKNIHTHDQFIIGEQDIYAPASILKVLVLITYLKKSEEKTISLRTTLKVTSNVDYNKRRFFTSETQLKPNNEYTIKHLLEKMIIDSDNNATVILNKNLNPDELKNTAKLLSIPFIDAPYDFMQVHHAAMLFESLYNNSYLSKDMSAYALDLLQQTSFSSGIRTTIPSDIHVASKHGERSISLEEYNQPRTELHDCGIIYYPDSPYILCIMTKGTDFNELIDLIQEISTEVYFSVLANGT
jgi:beta-lactamase class A